MSKSIYREDRRCWPVGYRRGGKRGHVPGMILAPDLLPDCLVCSSAPLGAFKTSLTKASQVSAVVAAEGLSSMRGVGLGRQVKVDVIDDPDL